MEKMFDSMSTEEKKNMVSSMMESFFASMSLEDKKQLMSEMMPKLMGEMMGAGRMPMMCMMGNSSSGNKKDTPKMSSMMEMCNMMMKDLLVSNSTRNCSNDVEADLKSLFSDWLNQVENEISAYMNETNSQNPEEIASMFKISTKSAKYFLDKMAKENTMSNI